MSIPQLSHRTHFLTCRSSGTGTQQAVCSLSVHWAEDRLVAYSGRGGVLSCREFKSLSAALFARLPGRSRPQSSAGGGT